MWNRRINKVQGEKKKTMNIEKHEKYWKANYLEQDTDTGLCN